jgi:hypothetical protein
MKKIAVIGTGSGGILSICQFLYYLKDYEVYSISDPAIPAVGIGESTNPFFFSVINLALQIGEYDDFVEKGELDSTIKLGTFFKDWRDNDFLNPLFGEGNNRKAIHFNTFKFKEFAFPRLRDIWKERFIEIIGNVNDLKNNTNDAVVIINGEPHSFDYVVDCRGFAKDHEDYHLVNQPVNHALIHNKTELQPDWKFTLHQATENGWMFGVPLKTRTSYGYLFNDTITDIETAKINFAKTINVPISELQNIEYKFKSYYTKKIIDNRLMRNGNNAVFFEPLIGNSLWIYDFINKLLCDYITGGENKYSESILNYIFQKKALEVHDTLCYYYHGGSKYDTPFWQNAVRYSSEVLSKSLSFKQLQDKFEYMKENNCMIPSEVIFGTESLVEIDKNLQYYYWSNKTESKNDN